MKRSISYTAVDGKVFPTRGEAVLHETKIKVRERMAGFFTDNLTNTQRSAIGSEINSIIDLLVEHAQTVAQLLSFRAARRQLRQIGGTSSINRAVMEAQRRSRKRKEQQAAVAHQAPVSVKSA